MSGQFLHTFKVRLLARALVWALVGGGLAGSPTTANASTASATANTTGPMTVYMVINPNDAPLNVQHVIAGPGSFSFSFWTTIPPHASATYHLRDIPQIPSPFQGTLRVYGNRPFSAQLVGYDNAAGQNSIFLPLVRR